MEELKLILESVSALGGDAKEVVIWWLVVDLLKSLMLASVMSVFGYVAYRLINKAIEEDRKSY